MADKYFSDEDCLQQPTFVQEEIVKNHEYIGGYKAIKYLKDGVTVLFNIIDNDWVALRPKDTDD